MKVTVLGTGRWGTCIAWYLNRTGHDMLHWGLADAPDFIELETARKNEYLKLSGTHRLTADLDEAVLHADVIVISISAQNLRSFAQRIKDNYDVSAKIFVLCMKGLEEDTGFRLSEIMRQVFGERQKIAVWVGPGHVQEYSKGVPNCMVIDSDDEAIKKLLVERFSSDLIRFYYGSDLVGTELGAASKNVMGIAAGMLDGKGLTSLKGALMARGVREISRLIVAMGGNELTAYGLAHLGDYEATVFSPHSHNRKFGELLAKSEGFDKLAEGVSTSKAMMVLKDRYHADLPICTAVYNVIYHKLDMEAALKELFLRSLKNEFY